MIYSQTEKPRPFSEMGKRCSRIFLNKYFSLLLFCTACGICVLEKEVAGAFLFVSLICLCLVLCDDIMAAALPFLLLCVFVTKCYDSASVFMKYAWMAVPAVCSLAFHIVVYRKKFVMGKSFWGLAAVAAAISLGGVSWISGYEYFSGAALYHTFFLGIGMVLIYLWLKSELSARRDYDLKEKLIELLYIMGAFTCFMVLFNVLPKTTFSGGIHLTGSFQPSNNTCTFLMFALPAPFFYVKKSRFHIFVPFFMVACMVLSGSRAGVLFGIIELGICLLVSALWDKKRRFLYICLAVSIVAALAVFRSDIIGLLQSSGMYPLVKDGEVRVQLIDRAFEMLKKNPIFGHGLGYHGNFDLYEPKSGAMGWYHMMIPQIVGSMGILGIAAYLFQGAMHIRITALAVKKYQGERLGAAVTLILSYVGVLLMSQVNPGLFCPLPYGLMATVIFAAIDGEDGLTPVLGIWEGLRKKTARKKAEPPAPEGIDAKAEKADEPKAETAIAAEAETEPKAEPKTEAETEPKAELPKAYAKRVRATNKKPEKENKKYRMRLYAKRS